MRARLAASALIAVVAAACGNGGAPGLDHSSSPDQQACAAVRSEMAYAQKTKNPLDLSRAIDVADKLHADSTLVNALRNAGHGTSLGARLRTQHDVSAINKACATHLQIQSTTTTLAPTTTAPPSPTSPSATLRTSCQSVVHIGDSTSESLVSPDYLPDPSQRLQAQYARVGATNSIMEIQGATSIVETLPGEQNAYQVAQSLINQGYNGCWVIALGTNDTADVYVGSNVGLAARIQRMMSLLGNQPVLWVNVVSLLNSGPYSEANMQQWDQALVQACPQYPNMRVFDWASVAQPSWFISDGIHYNSAGSAARAAAIANALAEGFPASAQTTGSVDHSGRGSSQSCLVQ